MVNVEGFIEGVYFFSEDIEFDILHEEAIKASFQSIVGDHKIQFGCINVVFCSDQHLLQMNKEYLDHDYFTDILTFPMSQDPLSGDLFISIERIRDYAESNNIPFSAELNRVMIHGLLHLVGYNDKTDEEKDTMREKENFYLDKLQNAD